MNFTVESFDRVFEFQKHPDGSITLTGESHFGVDNSSKRFSSRCFRAYFPYQIGAFKGWRAEKVEVIDNPILHLYDVELKALKNDSSF